MLNFPLPWLLPSRPHFRQLSHCIERILQWVLEGFKDALPHWLNNHSNNNDNNNCGFSDASTWYFHSILLQMEELFLGCTCLMNLIWCKTFKVIYAHFASLGWCRWSLADDIYENCLWVITWRYSLSFDKSQLWLSHFEFENKHCPPNETL